MMLFGTMKYRFMEIIPRNTFSPNVYNQQRTETILWKEHKQGAPAFKKIYL